VSTKEREKSAGNKITDRRNRERNRAPLKHRKGLLILRNGIRAAILTVKRGGRAGIHRLQPDKKEQGFEGSKFEGSKGPDSRHPGP
jgi:hypothetical protein